MKYGELTLGQMEAICNKLGGMDGVRDFLAGELTIKRPELLKRVGTIDLPAIERFVCDEETLKQANVGWTGDNFKKYFLGMTEENVPAVKVAGSTLLKDSRDPPIMAELADRATLQVANFVAAIKKQSKGEQGFLLVNGYWNVAYAIGNDGNIWAVDAYWSSRFGYWSVEARSVGYPNGWNTGRQILSCNS